MITHSKRSWNYYQEGNIIRDPVLNEPIILDKDYTDYFEFGNPRWEPYPLFEAVYSGRASFKFMGKDDKGISKFGLITEKSDKPFLVLYCRFNRIYNRICYEEKMWIIEKNEIIYLKYVHEFQNYLKDEMGFEIEWRFG
jgi:hypothetical protein